MQGQRDELKVSGPFGDQEDVIDVEDALAAAVEANRQRTDAAQIHARRICEALREALGSTLKNLSS